MKANIAYDNALKAKPRDSRILYERDQLWKQLGTLPDQRLREIEKHHELAMQRDDLSVELCALYNQIGQHAEALKIISTRNFQPWEGGEGLALGQYIRTHLLLGRTALSNGDAAKARGYFERALTTPRNLSEANHLLANRSDVHYWLATALEMLGDSAGANSALENCSGVSGRLSGNERVPVLGNDLFLRALDEAPGR